MGSIFPVRFDRVLPSHKVRLIFVIYLQAEWNFIRDPIRLGKLEWFHLQGRYDHW